MIASVADYPDLIDRLKPPLLFRDREMLGLLVLLLLTTIVAFCRVWRAPRMTAWSVILIMAPTFIGCGLAALQSVRVEFVLQMNKGGMGTLLRPDRYVGQIRSFLSIGMSTSVVLLCVAQLSRLAPRREDDD